MSQETVQSVVAAKHPASSLQNPLPHSASSTASPQAPGLTREPARESGEADDVSIRSSIVGERLTLQAFMQLSGNLAGYPYVKVVIDSRPEQGGEPVIHFINNSRHSFHADYIATRILGITRAELESEIDRYNQEFYLSPDRRFYLGILALHKAQEPAAGTIPAAAMETRFFSLETVEIDNMGAQMLRFFYGFIKSWLDRSIPVYFKPANHLQETIVAEIPLEEVPRVFNHELFANARFLALNVGTAKGRLRAFTSEQEYRLALPTIEWHDILVMHRVPDDVPRVSGIINAHHTTPLSHTNVLASGWGVPNSVQIGVFDLINDEKLNGQWVEYVVANAASQVSLKKIEKPAEANQRPSWSVHRIKLEEPETVNTPILDLALLRMSDRFRYGTKAANLGELSNILNHGSERLLGFYRIKRPPRPHLLGHLAKFLGVEETSDLSRAAWAFLRNDIWIPRGIAIPFSFQQEFLESSPRIQQTIGKLKMALELNSREIDSLCLTLQQLIRTTRMPDKIRSQIDAHIAMNLSGVSSFVVRSSSNAEDLEHFSAAGIYESINHVTRADKIFESIKEVWGSLLSPRSVRLRQQVGISLDDSYMGVIVQEEVQNPRMGGVLVTTNPMSRGDFRNVYINVSPKSVTEIVHGSELPYQYLYNTVEGGGRTLSLGDGKEDLPENLRHELQTLAFAGRLLQSHFSPDYLFSQPVDIEWLHTDEGFYIVQLRPYAG